MKQYDFMSDVDENGKEVVSVASAPKRKKIEFWPMLICFLIALMIWLYMVNLNDTSVTSTITIPIEVVGVDEIRAKNNLMLYGIDKTEIVITVKGSNRDLKRYTKDDYHAVVDVSEISTTGKHSLAVDITTPSATTITVDVADPTTISFFTDVSMTKQVPFDYLRGNWITNPNYTYTVEKSTDFVEISGPKNIIDGIEAAKFRIPEEEYHTSRSFSGFQLYFVDKNGDYVSYDNTIVSYSTAAIYVKVMVSTQKRIPVVVKLPDGRDDIIAKSDVETVVISGDPLLLNTVNEYTIVIAKDNVVSNSYVLISSDNLPEGVTVVEKDLIATITFEKKVENKSDAAASEAEPEAEGDTQTDAEQ